MSYSTENITEARKVLHFNRGTSSSIKTKPHMPGKRTLSPINFRVIRKELEADDEEPYSITPDSSENNLENEVTAQNEVKEEQITYEEKTTLVMDLMDSSNRRNDSFDLNFSALTCETPVKTKLLENSFKTPNVCSRTSIPPDREKVLQHQFATPRVNENIFKNQVTVRKSVFSTPTNVPFSCGKKLTPFTAQPVRRKKTNAPCQLATFLEESEESNKENVVNVDRSSIIVEKKISCKIIRVNKVEYVILGILGKGGSSEVFQCYNQDKNLHVAIKCVSLSNPTTADGFINEVKVLDKLQNCDKIVKMFEYEIVESEKKLMVVLEKGGEDLSIILKHLATKSSHLPMYLLLFYWMEMLYAVKQIHAHGIIHADLKPANFLRVEGGLKLIDFGISTCVDSDMTSVVKTSQEGTCNYISPEALNNDSSNNPNSPTLGKAKYKLNYKSDVWSLGCILYQMVYRKTPFQHIRQMWPKLAAILNPNHKIDFPSAEMVSPQILNTIKQCLQYDVKARPSVDQLILEYEQLLRTF